MSVICVGIPVIDGKPHYRTVDSLLAEQLLGSTQGVHLLVEWEVGCSLIGDARNRIAKRFLATPECKALVFVDADMSWPAGSLIRLAKSRKDVIGGTYRPKEDETRFHVHGKAIPKGRLWSVDGLPGGFLKISRKALSTMQEKARRYRSGDGTVTHDLFPMGFHRGTYYGEDYGFCRLWRETGGEVFLDPSIKLRHHDGMRVFTGDPAAWMRERYGAGKSR